MRESSSADLETDWNVESGGSREHVLHGDVDAPTSRVDLCGCTCVKILVALIIARGELRKVLFLALSVTFLFVYKISCEPLNGFAPNSHGRRVWFLARTSLNVKEGNFGGLRAVYVWKNIFALIVINFLTR